MSNNEVNHKTQSINAGQKDIVFETGGVKFILHVGLDIQGHPNPPSPDNPVPVPKPGPKEAGIALDGVKMMWPENPDAKVKPFFINLDNADADNEIFATTYGGDTVKFEKTMTEGNVKFARNKGHIQKYKSGAPDGKVADSI